MNLFSGSPFLRWAPLAGRARGGGLPPLVPGLWHRLFPLHTRACSLLRSPPASPPPGGRGMLAHSTDKTEGLSGPAGHIGRLFTSSPGGGGAGGWKDGKTHPGGVPGGWVGTVGGGGGSWLPVGPVPAPGPPALGPGSATHSPHAPKSGLCCTSEQFTTSAGESLICSQLRFNSQWPTCSQSPWDSAALSQTKRKRDLSPEGSAGGLASQEEGGTEGPG